MLCLQIQSMPEVRKIMDKNKDTISKKVIQFSIKTLIQLLIQSMPEVRKI